MQCKENFFERRKMNFKMIHDVADFLKNDKELLWREGKEGGIQYWYAESELYVIRKIENSDYVYGFVSARSPAEACGKFLCGSESQGEIAAKCEELKEMLLEKNRKYGNSALEPIRIFSRADAVEQILVRIDDKLNRIRNRQNDEDEDVIMDLAGYLILLMIAREKEKENA